MYNKELPFPGLTGLLGGILYHTAELILNLMSSWVAEHSNEAKIMHKVG